MLAIHLCSQEQMNNETLADDLQIEGEGQVRLDRLKLTHALDVAKIQSGIRGQILQNPIFPIRGRIQKKRVRRSNVEKGRQLCELLDSFLPTKEEKYPALQSLYNFDYNLLRANTTTQLQWMLKRYTHIHPPPILSFPSTFNLRLSRFGQKMLENRRCGSRGWTLIELTLMLGHVRVYQCLEKQQTR